jgi:hypothetical protein
MGFPASVAMLEEGFTMGGSAITVVDGEEGLYRIEVESLCELSRTAVR